MTKRAATANKCNNAGSFDKLAAPSKCGRSLSWRHNESAASKSSSVQFRFYTLAVIVIWMGLPKIAKQK